MISKTVLRTALWLALGGWVGAWAFFAFVVSRLAFQMIPGDVAGDMAGGQLAAHRCHLAMVTPLYGRGWGWF